MWRALFILYRLYIALFVLCFNQSFTVRHNGISNRKELSSPGTSEFPNNLPICCPMYSSAVGSARICRLPVFSLTLVYFHIISPPKNTIEITLVTTPATEAGLQTYHADTHKLYGIEQRPKIVVCSDDLILY
ncbi:hypothetical protein GQ44DRAFT_54377 [Phaeosphaeriaceae sp. PMI808]|nr:hypothetical protein GQ44DRAFT_54377 [Phaeosphaeriaceae sp. PMI808]